MMTAAAAAAAVLPPLFVRSPPKNAVYQHRLQEEFALIDRNQFVPVFLQVRRILELTQDIPHIIRGSAGSSLVCYLLGITQIDPIKHGLELARFMNTARADMPDIDMDFPYNRRDEVFDRINAAWPGQVARVSNHIMWKPRSALRAAAREAGVPARALHRGFRLEKVVSDPVQRAAIWRSARERIGHLRTHSLHCGGIVIFEEHEKVPSELLLPDGKPGQLHLNKDETEDAGLIKIDVLSNRGLAVLADLSPTAIDDYPNVCSVITEMFRRGDNIGITFAESRGMRKILAEMAPTSVTEVAMALALIRPAAAGNGHKQLFLEAWCAGSWDSDGTHNRILYDDDAIDTIRSLLNCDDATADSWRRAFAKGRTEKEAEFAMLLERDGHDRRTVNRTLENLRQLQLYSFCRSHALSYAQLVWALAYWKHEAPHDFWVAVLNHSHSDYRGWVHRRQARVAGLLLSRAPPPYKLGTRAGRPAVIPLPPLKEQSVLLPDEHPAQIQLDLRNHGVWYGSAFLEGCGIWNRQMLLGKPAGRQRVQFCGPIACGRVSGRDFKDPHPVTLIAIGVANGKYVDIVVEGDRGDLLGHFAIAGVGIWSARGPIETIVAERIHGCSAASLLGKQQT